MNDNSKTYKSQHQVFGTLEVTFTTDGAGDKYNQSSLIFKNLGGCYPFKVDTGFESFEGLNEVEVVFEGTGEETSLLECLSEIVHRAKQEELISPDDLETENRKLRNALEDAKDEIRRLNANYRMKRANEERDVRSGVLK